MTNRITWIMAAGLEAGLVACQNEPPKAGASIPSKTRAPIEEKLAQYTTVRLTSDLSKLSEKERRTRLHQRGELAGQDLDDNYVTFLASIFRSIRFGASNAHGRANASQFSFFEERGAFSRDSARRRYRVAFPRMRAAVDEMAGQILRFQGDGDYAGVTRFMAERGKLSTQLQQDLARLGSKGIPVDIGFDQGPEVLQ